ncbi:DNA-binding protein RFX2 [Vipera latastei]
MQTSEDGSNSATPVALRTSASIQPVPASQQRVLVQATSSTPKGVPMPELTLPRAQQVQTVVQHVYPAEVQYIEGGEAVYANGTLVGKDQFIGHFVFSRNFEQVVVSQGHQGRDPRWRQPVAKWGWGGVANVREGFLRGGGEICRALSPIKPQKPIPLLGSNPLPIILRRGNSKYHYYGIRLKPESPLNRLQEDAQYMAMRQQPAHQKQRYRPSQRLDGATEGGAISSPTPEESVAAQCQHHQQYIDVTHVLPEFPVLNPETVLLQEGIEASDLQALELFYRRHCEANVEVVMSLQLPFLEKLWHSFWNSESLPGRTGTSTPGASSEEPYEAVLPRCKLIALCKYELVLAWMRSCDNLLYQTLVEILIPDVLRPVPGTLTQAIRNFAKSLEGWLMGAMSEFPQPVVQSKVSVVSAFAQTLRRYTSLNHLAQAARAVLQNTSQINQMLSDLNRVDFANVQEQASWVCQCEEGLVQKLEQDFKVTLQQQSSLDQWARWLDEVVTQVLKPHEGAASFPRAARQFLLKWSFYSSMVIRDLTLRSAASFGSFHLIRLLYDEYMFYLVEHRVAEATGETPIAVMGEFSDLASLSPAVLDKDTFGALGHEAGACKPQVKREHSDPGPSLQEI